MARVVNKKYSLKPFITSICVVFACMSLVLYTVCTENAYSEGMDSQVKKFLKKVEKDSFKYFLHESNPNNGLVKDSSDPYSPCSIAAVGFGVTALCIAESHGWIPHEDAYNRVLNTLYTFRDRVKHKKGFYYHFVSMKTGKRVWRSEASSIDTALFIAGALFAGEFYKGTEVEKIADQLYRRVNWKWMLNGKKILCMGWKPETGFLPYYWDSYSESILLYALAIASPTYSIPKKSWSEWERPMADSKIGPMIYCLTGSLFVYQYSHAWIDLKYLYDGDINYFDNSIKATILNREYCIKKAKDFRTYGLNSWGLTASYGPYGYKGYGSRPGRGLQDGTVAPCAVAGSIPFAPTICINALEYMYRQFGNKVYGKYGFYDAYNIDKEWFCKKYLGIDQGITVLMIDDYLYGTVWKYFMRNRYIKDWVKKCMIDKRK
ncbi:MAG: glucoamylase family protein [Candidatus Ancaeobacter aquaticus]|nr:glucoamylase family protein [Candidatus Ancaeobacter aquaticus]